MSLQYPQKPLIDEIWKDPNGREWRWNGSMWHRHTPKMYDKEEMDDLLDTKSKTYQDFTKPTSLEDGDIWIELIGDEPFITKWDVTDTSIHARLGVVSGYTYSFLVDWGDGTSNYITDKKQEEVTHVYAATGQYIVSITGNCPTWDMLIGGNPNVCQVIDVVSWGNVSFVSLKNAFSYNTSITTLSAISPSNFSKVTNMYAMFYRSNLTTLDVSHWDTSSVLLMSHMFAYTNITDIDIFNWDISNVTTMYEMFNGTPFSNISYDKALLSWSQQTVQPNVNFHAGTAKYTESAAKAILTGAPNNWIITDGGAA